MKGVFTSWVVAAALLPAVALGQGQDPPKKEEDTDRRQWWALDVGAYFPVDAEIRDRFSDVLIRVGFRPYRVPQADKGRWVFDFGVIGAKNGDSRMLVIPLTIGWLQTSRSSTSGCRSWMASSSHAGYERAPSTRRSTWWPSRGTARQPIIRPRSTPVSTSIS